MAATTSLSPMPDTVVRAACSIGQNGRTSGLLPAGLDGGESRLLHGPHGGAAIAPTSASFAMIRSADARRRVTKWTVQGPFSSTSRSRDVHSQVRLVAGSRPP